MSKALPGAAGRARHSRGVIMRALRARAALVIAVAALLAALLVPLIAYATQSHP
jgi:hypothetical protein